VLVVVVLLVAGAVVFGWDRLDASRSAASSPASEGQPVDPSVFAAGACVEFGPTTGDRKKTVFLDAGHGGIDPGGVGTTESGQAIYEADETLPVELDAMALLRARGFSVVVSRTTASTVVRLGPGDESGGVLTLQGAHDDVAARDLCADDAKADVLVGIYFDANDSPQTAGSLTAYDADRPFSAANLKLANLLQADVLADMNAQGWGIPNDGVVTDTSLGSYVGDPSAGGIAAEAANYDHLLLIGPAAPGFFTTPSEMPGAVTEPMYITDPYEGSIVDSAHGQMVIGEGIATAIEQYLEPPTASTKSASGTS
jgi:N-acetylmuramoyl-L-alanine amidase